MTLWKNNYYFLLEIFGKLYNYLENQIELRAMALSLKYLI